MRHHLAHLIEDAGEDGNLTPEQRIEVVELILRIWGARRSLPQPTPGYATDNVMRALDRLGDESPRIAAYGVRSMPEDPSAPGATLAELAVRVDKLAQLAITILLSAALEQATEQDADWIEADTLLGTANDADFGRLAHRVDRRLRRLAASSEGGQDLSEESDGSGEHAASLRQLAAILISAADSLSPGEEGGSGA